MDIALGTVVFIFLLVVPNTVFRRFFYTGPFSLEYFKPTPFLSFISSIVPGFLLHISFFYLIIVFFPDFFFAIQEIFLLFIQPIENIDKVNSVEHTKRILITLFHYNIFLWLYVIILAVLSKSLIRRFRIDRKIKLLRFRNNWHYIFSGEILDFPDIKGKTKNISFTYIDIMVNINGDAVLYSGLYYDHVIALNGFSLESLSICQVTRRFVDNPPLNKEKIIRYSIPGDYLLIPATNIINMNVSYYHLSKTSSSMKSHS